MVDAAEIGLADERGNTFGGGEGSSGERGESGGVEFTLDPDLSDDKAAFVDHDGGGAFAFDEEFLQGAIQLLNILFDELRKCGHS